MKCAVYRGWGSIFLLGLFWILAGLLGKSPAKARSEQSSSFEKILQMYRNEEINFDTKGLYLGYALKNPAALPSNLRSQESQRCATWVLEEIYTDWRHYSSDVRTTLQQIGFLPNGILSRPTGLDSFRTTAHFRIHYTTAFGDSNAVSSRDWDGNGTPDYIDMVMDILEYVWTFFNDTLGYNMPPFDGTAGGDSLYDVYIMNLESGIYGYVALDSIIHDNPSTPENEKNSGISYMALRNNYQGFSGGDERNLKVTIAHELFHSIQFGYDVYEKAWLKEATATWVEDEIYDNINDNYQYLISWFGYPGVPLDANQYEKGGHWYGSWIYFRYLSEHVGGRALIRQIWERSLQYDSKMDDYSIQIIKDELSRLGTTFEDVFQEFAVTNWVRTIPPYQYEEGQNYPDIATVGNIWNNQEIQGKLQRYANDYIRIAPLNPPVTGTDKIRIYFEPTRSDNRFRVQVVTISDNTVQVDQFYPEYSSTWVEFTAGLDQIVVIVSNPDTNSYQNRYKLRVEYLGSGSFTRILDGQLWGWNILDAQDRFIGLAVLKELNGKYYSYSNRIDLRNGEHIVHIWKNSITVKLGYQSGNMIIIDDRNYSTYVMRSGSFYPLTEGLFSDNKDEPRFSVEYSDTDNDYFWVFGGYKAPGSDNQENGFYQVHTQYKTVRTIIPNYYEGRSIVADGNDAAICYSRHDSSITRLFHVRNGNSRLLLEKYSDETPLSMQFRDSLIVWKENDGWPGTGGPFYLKAYDTKNDKFWILDYLDTSETREIKLTHFITKNRRVAWVREYWRGTSEGDTTEIFLWNADTQTLQRIAVLQQGYRPYGKIVMDHQGVGWVLRLWTDMQFYYYEWDTGNTFSRSIMYNQLDIPSGNFKKMTLVNGNFVIAAKQDNEDGIFLIHVKDQLTSINQTETEKPLASTYRLYPNYPNPFNPVTVIPFFVPRRSHVTLTIYDLLGRRVKTLVDASLSPGLHKISFDGSNLSSGIYFYQLKAGSVTYTRRMAIIR
ncbi:MAG: T9SS type A sorting domain-containing protein [Calditrichaeota bacterium]|nr:T9SS type A sorting domain-containing protein [Calditrichota bacterium]